MPPPWTPTRPAVGSLELDAAGCREIPQTCWAVAERTAHRDLSLSAAGPPPQPHGRFLPARRGLVVNKQYDDRVRVEGAAGGAPGDTYASGAQRSVTHGACLVSYIGNCLLQQSC